MADRAEMAALFAQYHQEHHFAGSALIKQEDEVVFQCAHGLAHRAFHRVP